jgi:peptidoglycan/xylan/chitin deacetylase (PgdA/CDA1 family)
MLFAKTPPLLSRFMNDVTWDFYGEQNKIYLTFDDGPTEGVTPRVLEMLAKHEAKATFFCLGRNVEKHPDIYRMILEDGHSVGNHSYSHLKGFRSSLRGYVEDVKLAGKYIDSKLFRPPYGRIYPAQVRALKKNYQIIMWDVLSVDYNPRISGDRVVHNVVSNVQPGSIVVFHDSDKAASNLYHALPSILKHLDEQGYAMAAIPDNHSDGSQAYN